MKSRELKRLIKLHEVFFPPKKKVKFEWRSKP